MAWKKFSATLSYLGGKRKLVKHIFEHIPPSHEAPVLADCFMGGGSVSLLAKAKGYQVFGNDIAERSAIVGRSLIENRTTLIQDHDILRLFEPIETDHFVEKQWGGKIFTTQVAQFIDRFRAHINAIEEEPKRSLMQLLLMRYCLKIRPFGIMSATNNIKELEKGNIEEPLSHPSNGRDLVRQVRNPEETLKKIAQSINSGVFDNGLENKMNRGDVFEFLKNIKADIAYFDPPYADTASYEESYKVLDQIMEGKRLEQNVSGFSKGDAVEFQDKLFKAAQHIPHWIISMGQNDPSKGIGPEELLALVRKYKPNAQVKYLPHIWTSKNTGKGDQKEAIEYLIYTWQNK